MKQTVANMGAYILQIAFWVTVGLAGLALALTVSGLFSVLSYQVEQRANRAADDVTTLVANCRLCRCLPRTPSRFFAWQRRRSRPDSRSCPHRGPNRNSDVRASRSEPAKRFPLLRRAIFGPDRAHKDVTSGVNCSLDHRCRSFSVRLQDGPERRGACR